MKRTIIKIDQEKCTGCGLCVPACAEGALKIIDGKVRLVSEKFCDGLGACLGKCPVGALIVETRDAEEFDEEAAKAQNENLSSEQTHPTTHAETLPSEPLSQWPIHLQLVSVNAPFLKNADLVMLSDDPTNIDAEKIKSINVEMTVINGEIVWRNE